MEETILAKCPNCGFNLTSLHRKGNWMRCPGCKSSFNIGFAEPKVLGKCPHGCREELAEEDYIEWGVLKCPLCQKKSTTRDTREKTILLKYAGRCPSCDMPIAEDDCIGDGEYICPQCKTSSFKHPRTGTPLMANVCPLCGEAICVSDIDEVFNAWKCPKCGNSYQIKEHVELFFEHETYTVPHHSLKEFQETCFDRLMRFAPKDIFTKMQIEEMKMMYFPFSKFYKERSRPLFDKSYNIYLSQNTTEISDDCIVPRNAYFVPMFNVLLSTNREKYNLDSNPRCRCNERDLIPKDNLGKTEFIPITHDVPTGATIEYKVMYYLRYSYDGDDNRLFYNWDNGYNSNLKEQISFINMPMLNALNRIQWYDQKILNIIYWCISVPVVLLGLLVPEGSLINRIFWGGFAILAANFLCLTARKLLTDKGEKLRKNCQKQKSKDLERVFHYRSIEDYTNLTKYYQNQRQNGRSIY